MRMTRQQCLLVCLCALAACRGTPTASERAAQDLLARTEAMRGDATPLPTADSPVGDYVRRALHAHPAVIARFEAWRQAVAEITVARSLPDPMLSLGVELSRMEQVLMPGLSMPVPGPGKLELAAEAQSELAAVRRFEFEREAASVATRTCFVWLDAAFLAEAVRIDRDAIVLLDELAGVAATQFRVGKVTQQDVLRLDIERAQLRNELASLEDGRGALAARMREALGVPTDEAAPPLPQALPAEPQAPLQGELVEELLANNRELQAMAAEIRQAESFVALARKSATPDFLFGVEVDVASPLLVTPEIGMTLPIWRDKIEATVAAAEAMRKSAGARLDAGRLEQVVRLAEATFDHRDAQRRLLLARNELLPAARAALAIARAGYATSRTDLTSLLDAERSLLAFQLDEARARKEMDQAWARLTYELLARAGRLVPP